MRICIIGQSAFGEKVTRVLLDGGEDVVGVITTPDIPGRVNPLKNIAVKLGIPLLQPGRMRSPGVFESYAKLKPELNVMAYVTDILPDNILNYPELGTIQYHPSLLPKHRGGSAINWVIINGETRTGVTIFWPDKGIDTGPILLQKAVDISPDDTVGSLYYDKLFPLGIEALIESIGLIKRGQAPRIPQNESGATYEGLCTEKDAFIDWQRTARKVYNLIRGTNPQPGATTRFQGKRLKVFDSALVSTAASGTAGEIIEISELGFTVAAINGAILVKRVQPAGAGKITAVEFVKQENLRWGDSLGN